MNKLDKDNMVKYLDKSEIQHWIGRWSKLKGPKAKAVINIWKRLI